MADDLHIQLQSSTSDFDKDFLIGLSKLEQTMIKKGLDPSAFVIAKDHPQFPIPYIFGGDGFKNDYTVFTGDKSFTVTKSSDLSFLEYFAECCFASDNAAEDKRDNPQASLIGRLEKWLKEKPDFLKEE